MAGYFAMEVDSIKYALKICMMLLVKNMAVVDDDVIMRDDLLHQGNTYGVSIPKIGKDRPHDNLQPYITMNYIIKF